MNSDKSVNTKNTAPDRDLSADLYPEEKKHSFRAWWNRVSGGKYFFLVYCFLIPVVLFYLMYLSRGVYPFGTGSVLVLDLNGQYVYFYEALRNAVYGETSLLYSFARQLGGEFIGIYAYYVASPLSYIVCLFPQDRILEALLFIFLLKAGISGVTTGYYLSRISSRLNRTAIVMFSVMYAMCTYAVIQQHNSMWMDAFMWLPLLTLGIESLIREKKYKLYVSMLALCLWSNFYIGYMCCIYTIIYFFYYYFSRNENNRNNPLGESNHFGRTLIRIGCWSLLAIGISAFIIFGAYTSLKFGKSTFSNPDFSFTLRFDILDFLKCFLPGSYDTVRPEGLPFVYCGILTLFCVPIYFFSNKFSTREKIFSAAIIGIFVLSFMINTIDMIWHGFQKPNWLNYRYSFMLDFILIVLAYKGYNEAHKVSAKVIAAMTALLILFLGVAQKFTYHGNVERISGTVEFDQELKDLEVIFLSLICIITFAVLLCALIKSKRKENVALVTCVLVCVELFASGVVNCLEFGDDVIYSSYTSYNDFISALRPMTEELLETDTGFYRFEKNVHRKYCDNMALNIRGLTNSSSTLNKSTIEFLAKMGYASKSHWSKYLGGTPLNDSLLGIKYIIAGPDDHLESYYEETDITPIVYNSVEYKVYENPYALSVAYAVDDSVLSFDMKSDSPMLRLNELVSAMLGREEAAEFFVPLEYDTTTENLNITASTSTYVTYKPVNSSSDASLTYTFVQEEDGEVFFYLPSNYPREVRVSVNGKSKGNFYASETTRIFSLGTFTKGTEVNVKLVLDADVVYITPDVPALFTLDMDATAEALSELAEGQLEIESWDSTHFNGTLSTDKESTAILTTIPWDSGWKVTVDGEAVETYKTLDALIGFTVEGDGEHTVTMVYRPTWLTVGGPVSVISLALFVLIIIFEKRLAALFSPVLANLRSRMSKDIPSLDAAAVSEDDSFYDPLPPDGGTAAGEDAPLPETEAPEAVTNAEPDGTASPSDNTGEEE